MQALAGQLTSDIYVRKIDLEKNKIQESDILGEFLEALKFNESLVNVNFAGNAGHTHTVKEKVALCLLKNLDLLKSDQVPIRSSWIDTNQIKVIQDQLDEFVEGFTYAEEEAYMTRGGNREVQLLKSVQPDNSFQIGKPNLQQHNRKKSLTSVKSRGDDSKQVTIKSRVDVSGDRSMDMFASDLNSQMLDDSTAGYQSRKASQRMSVRKSTPSNAAAHLHNISA